MVVVLVGFMGAGKTTVGQIMAERLGLPFVDTDVLIEQRLGRDIRDIFRTEGEPYFRELEHQTVAGLVRGPDAVTALGGGAAEDPRSQPCCARPGSSIFGSAMTRPWPESRAMSSGPCCTAPTWTRCTSGLPASRQQAADPGRHDRAQHGGAEGAADLHGGGLQAAGHPRQLDRRVAHDDVGGAHHDRADPRPSRMNQTMVSFGLEVAHSRDRPNRATTASSMPTTSGIRGPTRPMSAPDSGAPTMGMAVIGSSRTPAPTGSSPCTFSR
jgi:hypothetical protein